VTGGRQFGEELLCLFSVSAVPRGYGCALAGQALTDRCTDSPGTAGHERYAPVHLRLAHSLGLVDLFDRCGHDDHLSALARAARLWSARICADVNRRIW